MRKQLLAVGGGRLPPDARTAGDPPGAGHLAGAAKIHAADFFS